MLFTLNFSRKKIVRINYLLAASVVLIFLDLYCMRISMEQDFLYSDCEVVISFSVSRFTIV